MLPAVGTVRATCCGWLVILGALTGVWLVLTATWALAASSPPPSGHGGPARPGSASPPRSGSPAAVYLATVAFEAARGGAYLDRGLWAVEAVALTALAGGVAWGSHVAAARARRSPG